jgi:alcohol dehydrogenase, propanol-preferring
MKPVGGLIRDGGPRGDQATAGGRDLGAEGALASVGLIGRRVEMPLFPFVSGEKSYFGSFWRNYNEPTEVLSLADEGLIKHNVNQVKLDDINDNLEALGRGDVVGRAVIVYH